MRTNKRRFGVSLALILSIGVMTACADSGNKESSNEDFNSDSPSGELRISWMATEEPGITAVVEKFRSDYPDVKVELTSADIGAYQATLRTELSAGNAADVIFAWSPSNAGGIRTLDEGGYLMDLSDQEWVADYPEGLKPGTESEDGRTLLMAPMTMGFNAIYNQTELDELGIDAPTTWDEVFDYCDAAVDAGRYGYALAGAEPYGSHAPFMSIAADLVYGHGFEFDEQIVTGETTFPTHEGYKEAFERYEELLDSNCIPPNSSGVNYDELNRQLATGEALGSIMATLRLAQVQAAAPESEFRIYGFDSDNDSDTNKEILSIQGGAAIPANAKNPSLSKFFVNYLADNIETYWKAHEGTAPTMPDRVDVSGDPNVEFLTSILERGDNVPYLNTYWCAETEAAMVAGNEGLVVGTTTGTDVLDAMQAAYDGCR